MMFESQRNLGVVNVLVVETNIRDAAIPTSARSQAVDQAAAIRPHKCLRFPGMLNVDKRLLHGSTQF